MNRKTAPLLAGIAGLVFGAASVQAAPVVYFGENTSPMGTVTGDPAAARAAFDARLVDGVGVENFESLPSGNAAPFDLSFPGSSATLDAQLNGSGVIGDGPLNGRFNVSPGAASSKYLDTDFNFSINFARPIAAFGFYGTDIGDFGGVVRITLTPSAGGSPMVFDVRGDVTGNSGSLLFWGFVDSEQSYSRLQFSSTVSDDTFGFDDMVIADLGQIRTGPPDNGGPGEVPEPGSLALAGLAMASLVAVRRRRQR